MVERLSHSRQLVLVEQSEIGGHLAGFAFQIWLYEHAQVIHVVLRFDVQFGKPLNAGALKCWAEEEEKPGERLALSSKV